jgi:hypothetical protein
MERKQIRTHFAITTNYYIHNIFRGHTKEREKTKTLWHHSDCHKGFDSLVVLVTWHLWKERNAQVFDQASRQAGELVSFVICMEVLNALV